MNFISRAVENGRRMKILKRVFRASLGLAAAADVFLAATGRTHGHLDIENLPGFGAAAGLLFALGIAGLAKLLGKLLLTRKEDYYD